MNARPISRSYPAPDFASTARSTVHTLVTPLKVYVLTGLSTVAYVLLTLAFSDGAFTSALWNSNVITESSIFPYLFAALILIAGSLQARQTAADGIAIRARTSTNGRTRIDNPIGLRLLFNSPRFAVIWLPIRFFLGWQWISSAEGKFRSDGWMQSGAALQGFWQNAVAVPEDGTRPAISYGWYREFLQFMLDREWFTWFAKLVAWGEFLVGLGILFGAFIGIAAFFGASMNLNFMLAGSASANPVLFLLGALVLAGWKVAGYLGLDRVLLPAIGTPWQRGTLLESEPELAETPNSATA
jgi:thiosulfate dehydrogenase [quinone] large subunit